MSDIEERIKAILELDEKRTQGEGLPTLDFCGYDYDVNFVKAAPEMVDIIKIQAARIAELEADNGKYEASWKEFNGDVTTLPIFKTFCVMLNNGASHRYRVIVSFTPTGRRVITEEFPQGLPLAWIGHYMEFPEVKPTHQQETKDDE